MQCVEACLQKAEKTPDLDLLVTGGAETTGHSRGSHHYLGEACDFAGTQFNKTTKGEMFDCASKCGFRAGQYETFPNSPNKDHFHFQRRPGNGVPVLPYVTE